MYLIDESQNLKNCDEYANATLCYSDFYFYKIKLDNLLKISAGETSASFYIKSVDDQIVEGDEKVNISIDSVNNANQADNTEKSFKIIDDDDPTITISLSNSSRFSVELRETHSTARLSLLIAAWNLYRSASILAATSLRSTALLAACR